MSSDIPTSALDSIPQNAVTPPADRPAWRQRFIEAERGITQSIRRDSIFFVYMFAASVVVAACLVLGISYLEWAVVVLAITMVLASELFNQVLRAIASSVGHHLNEQAQRAFRIGTAAVFVTITGTFIVIAIVLVRNAWELFSK